MSQRTLAAIHAARTQEDVLNAVRDYLGGWIPTALARLPLHVRVSEINAPDDVTRIAVDIAHQRLDVRTERDVLDVLEQLHPFFIEAAARLSQLQTHSMHQISMREAARRLF
ncbi:MAG: hypothetical protein ACXWGU_13510 [Usitatibacter sp.]